MRTELLSACVLLSLGAMGQPLAVVVTTLDPVVREFTSSCPDANGIRGSVLLRREVYIAGRVTWHTVGGVEPITLVSKHHDGSGNVEITVMDALGTIAIGYGVVQTVRTTHAMPCPARGTVQPAARAANAVPATPAQEVGMKGLAPRPRAEVQMRREQVGAGERERERPAARVICAERGGSGGGGSTPTPTRSQHAPLGRR